jgi:hypothetical protein
MRQSESGGADWQEIRVDLGSLQGLADDLLAEVSYHLRPAVSWQFDQYRGEARFGVRSPSVDLHAVKSRYMDCLRATVDRLATYVEESSLLVDAAGEILARYQTTDALASASLDDIGKLLGVAAFDDQTGG